LNKLSFVEISENELSEKITVVSSKPVLEQKIEAEQKAIEQIQAPEQKQKAQNSLDAKRAIIQTFNNLNIMPEVRKVDDLNREEVKRKVLKQVEKNLSQGQQNLFKDEIVKEAEAVYDLLVTEFKKNTIEIPRMDLVQGEVTAIFHPFDLDIAEFNYQALEQEIHRQNLTGEYEIETLRAAPSGSYGNPVNLIISTLLDYPEIDYDDNAVLLRKLATQAYEAVKENLNDASKIKEVIFQFKQAIAEKIYNQMKDHFELSRPDYVKPNVLPFVKIEEHNFSALVNSGYRDYREIIQPTSMIPKYVFRGFEKAGHLEYKFDSKTEQDLAFVLENDTSVLKWLRPAPNQFRIYWDNNSKRYEPDFVVETADAIFIIETKAANEIQNDDVLAKKAAAEKYCRYATEYTSTNDGKSWKYLLIPHHEVSRTVGLDYLISLK